MDKRRNGGTTKKWWGWTLCAEDAVYYDIRDKRASEVVMDMLHGYAGTLMVDGHGAYKKGRKRGARYTLAFCWSHYLEDAVIRHSDVVLSASGVAAPIGSG